MLYMKIRELLNRIRVLSNPGFPNITFPSS